MGNSESKIRVAPARERGLKLLARLFCLLLHRRSREGAWIEMMIMGVVAQGAGVAPARERGLKWAP